MLSNLFIETIAAGIEKVSNEGELGRLFDEISAEVLIVVLTELSEYLELEDDEVNLEESEYE